MAKTYSERMLDSIEKQTKSGKKYGISIVKTAADEAYAKKKKKKKQSGLGSRSILSMFSKS